LESGIGAGPDGPEMDCPCLGFVNGITKNRDHMTHLCAGTKHAIDANLVPILSLRPLRAGFSGLPENF
jgi:hypothetical protein